MQLQQSTTNNFNALLEIFSHSILDHEWPRLRKALTTWLAPHNFDRNGQQLTTLQSIRENFTETGNNSTQ
jgi:hypothetical protein